MKDLPRQFYYLAATAMRYGADAVQVDNQGRSYDRNRFIADLSDTDLAQLTETYLQIEHKEDAQAISDWLNAEGVRVDGATRRVFLLFVLFQHLGKLGIHPFDTGAVRLYEPRPSFDWSKLPASLDFLARPAEEYGRHQFPEEVDNFLASATPEQMAELRQLVKRCKDESKAIDDFLGKYSLADHPEAANVYFLLGILDHPLVTGE